MKRHIFLVPGFFGFANLGDFAYWGPAYRQLEVLLREAGMPAKIHCVKSLPTASLRTRTRCLLKAIADARPGSKARIHLIGHSTGGLDARLLLTPAVDLETKIDVEGYALNVRSSISIATPHRGAPIASYFVSIMGRKLLQILSVLTMAALRNGELPLSVWAKAAGLFALPASDDKTTGTLAGQLYRQLLSDFNEERHYQVVELLTEVERDQALLTQLTVETMDLFNAAAGDREGVLYGSVVTKAHRPGLSTSLEIGLDPVAQAQHAFYYSLSHLASGYEFPAPGGKFKQALLQAFGDVSGSLDNDGIVPTLSQPWGHCIALANADHLDIIGHYSDNSPSEGNDRQYDWLSTRSNFTTPQFREVWQKVVDFIAEAEA
jgi:triacylglycerol esterase/lipase EstA (alpha/beta hydrolase family)